MALDPAELPEQVLGNHEKVRRIVQPSERQIIIELIDRVEGLELDAGLAVKSGKRHTLMCLRDDALCAAVAIGIAGPQLRIIMQQHIVNAPGIHRKTFYSGKSGLCFCDALPHRCRERFHIPDEMTVLRLHAVRETIDLFRFQFTVLHPTDDVTSGGCADVNCEVIIHNDTPLSCLSSYRIRGQVPMS